LAVLDAFMDRFLVCGRDVRRRRQIPRDTGVDSACALD